MKHSEEQSKLNKAWKRALKSGGDDSDDEVDRLVNSSVLSIRYALVTQLLGKIVNHDRSLLCLQLGKGESGETWDARSLCSKVIVPWVSENHYVLGKSNDPYVNNPLRRPRLDQGTDKTKPKVEWDALVEFLKPLDSSTHEEVKTAFDRCLFSIARRLKQVAFNYPIPLRISLPTMLDTLEVFLAERSGGLRAMVVATAMLKVLGKAFSIFKEVTSQGLNEADASSGALGDIMCHDINGDIVLAIEVKDKNLTLTEVQSSAQKVKKADKPLYSFLFATSGIRKEEEHEIRQLITKEWASGLNINRIDILDLANVTFSLLHEELRRDLLRVVGVELDNRAELDHRLAWRDLMSKLNQNT